MLPIDIEKPIQIAPQVWWVGYVIPNDPFQCHVYLIENGNESILIDPGSKITWEVTRDKISQIIPLENIKYIICHHQDPDITSCIEDLLQEIGTKNRYIVTHWRTKALLRHYNWGVEFYDIDENDWQLKTKEKLFRFIFTPYMHFPGAICSYLENERILFSSDIFGAFTEEFSLYAKDAKRYFEQMKPFHQHYMPSSEIVQHGLEAIEKYDIELIAPQHGSIIPKKMIGYIIDKLKRLEVGLYLEFEGGSNIRKLSLAHKILSILFERVSMNTGTMYKEVGTLFTLIQEVLPLERVVCVTYIEDIPLVFDSLFPAPKELEDIPFEELQKFITSYLGKKDKIEKIDKILSIELGNTYQAVSSVVTNQDHHAIGVCFYLFDEIEELTKEDIVILHSFEKIFSIMLMKEREYYQSMREKRELFQKVITDGLTKVYNRYYFDEMLEKEFQKAIRYNYPLSIAMIDLDDFKKINDSYGHNIGDLVLRDFANILKENVRESDQVFRYGGEEFVILMPFTLQEEAWRVIERIRQMLHQRSVTLGNEKISYTFSSGIAQTTPNINTSEELIEKADSALYKAKKEGKDRIKLA